MVKFILNQYLKLLVIMIFVLWIIILLFRDFSPITMVDAYNYIYIAIGEKENVSYTNGIEISEPAFLYLLYLLGWLEEPFFIQACFLLIAYSLFFYSIKKVYSGNIPLKYIYFSMVCNSSLIVLSANLWRQFLAIIMMMTAFSFMEKNKYKGAITSLLSIFTHYSCVIYILIYVLCTSNRKKFLRVLLFILILSFIIFDFFSSASMGIIPEGYLSYLNNEDPGFMYRKIKLTMDVILIIYISGVNRFSQIVILSYTLFIFIPFSSVFGRLTHLTVAIYPFAISSSKNKFTKQRLIALWILIIENLYIGTSTETFLSIFK